MIQFPVKDPGSRQESDEVKQRRQAAAQQRVLRIERLLDRVLTLRERIAERLAHCGRELHELGWFAETAEYTVEEYATLLGLDHQTKERFRRRLGLNYREAVGKFDPRRGNGLLYVYKDIKPEIDRLFPRDESF